MDLSQNYSHHLSTIGTLNSDIQGMYKILMLIKMVTLWHALCFYFKYVKREDSLWRKNHFLLRKGMRQ